MLSRLAHTQTVSRKCFYKFLNKNFVISKREHYPSHSEPDRHYNNNSHLYTYSAAISKYTLKTSSKCKLAELLLSIQRGNIQVIKVFMFQGLFRRYSLSRVQRDQL